MSRSDLFRNPLLHCVLIGTLAFFVNDVLTDKPASSGKGEIHFSAEEVDALKAEWRQQLGRPLTPSEFRASLQATVDEHILIQEALERGWDRTDPIVRRRLTDNLNFTEHHHPGEADMLATARALGMPLLDPVVRKRLVLRMQAALRSQADTVPNEEELAHYANTVSSESRRWTLSHVMRNGPDAQRQLQALTGLSADVAARYSDPFLAGNVFKDTTDQALEKTFGPGFVAQLATLPTGQWAGPVKSVFGLHLVWIEKRQMHPVPVNPGKAYLAWKAEQETRALQNGLAQLRQQYRVSWED